MGAVSCSFRINSKFKIIFRKWPLAGVFFRFVIIFRKFYSVWGLSYVVLESIQHSKKKLGQCFFYRFEIIFRKFFSVWGLSAVEGKKYASSATHLKAPDSQNFPRKETKRRTDGKLHCLARTSDARKEKHGCIVIVSKTGHNKFSAKHRISSPKQNRHLR